jgi:uncharacterized membrane protein
VFGALEYKAQTIRQKNIAPDLSERLARIASVDTLRGLVMVIMALDHTRDFFTSTGFSPRDVTDPPLFLTRWVTHFCAPTFILLAGLSAFLYGRGRSLQELSRFLLVRGLWLILLDLTLIKFGWRFEFDFYRLGAGVIFVIGASMMVLAGLIWLPRWAIASFVFVMLAGHNLLDSVTADGLGDASWAWHVLHEPGLIPLDDSATFYILYPLIPWVGVMACGYLLGPVMQLERGKGSGFCLASVLRSPWASWHSAPPTSMATRGHGHPKTLGYGPCCHSSTVKSTRRRYCI